MAIRLVAIGASTGGPLALAAILAMLPQNFAAPIAIVQHMSPGFTEGFVQWLAATSGFPVQMAGEDERFEVGHAYVAPDGRHLRVRIGPDGHCWGTLSCEPQENGHQPSVSLFFRSVMQVLANQAIGVLLTGMGKDGAVELRALRDAGAVTVAQEIESCVVSGMPGEAIRLDAARHVLPPDQIGKFLASLVKQHNHG